MIDGLHNWYAFMIDCLHNWYAFMIDCLHNRNAAVGNVLARFHQRNDDRCAIKQGLHICTLSFGQKISFFYLFVLKFLSLPYFNGFVLLAQHQPPLKFCLWYSVPNRPRKPSFQRYSSPVG